MRVNREESLRALESVSPGLSDRELIEQSSCLIFQDGDVVTFNGEVMCCRESPFANIEGAVKAKPLLSLLSRLSEDTIDVEQSGSELVVSGIRRKSGIRMEDQISLQIDVVEDARDWRDLHPDFSDAIRVCHTCAATTDEFILTCIHIHPDYVEACDRYRIVRYSVETGVENPILVRASSVKSIVGFDMTEVSESDNWIHFRNPAGLVLGCRRYVDDYVDLGAHIARDGAQSVTLPGDLESMVRNAEVFSQDNPDGNYVLVSIKSDRVLIEGRGADGWYKEMKKISYSGPEIRFFVPPKLLVEVASKSSDCGICGDRIYIDTTKYQYVACTESGDQKQDQKQDQG